MEVFEIYFNPKQRKEDLIFNSFCYEPTNVYEKKLGHLFLVGELKNVLPQNSKFLDNLAIFLKKHYYSNPTKFPIQVSLKETLKKVNEFLENIAKSDNVSWLGNLNFVVISLNLQKWEINFTKVGIIKILLLKNNQIIDIGKNLEFSEIQPYPLKIFNNIVSGKLAENDIILIQTKEVFDFFNTENLINQIAQGRLKEILKIKEKEFSKISGICLLLILKKEFLPKKEIIFQEEISEFSLKKLFPLIIAQGKKLPTLPTIKISQNFKKNLILVLLLGFFLIFGFFIFNR